MSSKLAEEETPADVTLNGKKEEEEKKTDQKKMELTPGKEKKERSKITPPQEGSPELITMQNEERERMKEGLPMRELSSEDQDVFGEPGITIKRKRKAQQAVLKLSEARGQIREDSNEGSITEMTRVRMMKIREGNNMTVMEVMRLKHQPHRFAKSYLSGKSLTKVIVKLYMSMILIKMIIKDLFFSSISTRCLKCIIVYFDV